jgi:aminoglycoside 6'-N-acetyltransferase
MLASWRQQPHVREWWGSPEAEDAAETLADGRVTMWVVEREGRPFAYAQDYSPHDWNPHPFRHLPPGSRGIDQYIGDPTLIGRGLGSAFVRQHVARLFAAGAPVVGTDPHPDNARAIAAYRKAGFEITAGPLDTRWGRALLMECRR